MHNTCIIIQGPLVTFGQGPIISREGFRAYESIIHNTLLILANNITPVLCLWSSDQRFEDFDRVVDFYTQKGLHFLIIDVPAKSDPDHRYKHHYAVQQGLLYARDKLSASFFIKIRSDHKINEQILKELTLFPDHKKLMISELMKNNNFYIGDFVYAGKIETVGNYLDCQVKTNEGKIKYSVIANDLGFNFYRSTKPVNKKWLILLFLFFKKKATIMWQDFINEHIFTLSQEAWNSLIWRDVKISDVVNADNFCFVDSSVKVELTESIGLPHHTYYVKGKYKRFLKRTAKKMGFFKK